MPGTEKRSRRGDGKALLRSLPRQAQEPKAKLKSQHVRLDTVLTRYRGESDRRIRTCGEKMENVEKFSRVVTVCCYENCVVWHCGVDRIFSPSLYQLSYLSKPILIRATLAFYRRSFEFPGEFIRICLLDTEGYREVLSGLGFK